MNDNGAGYSGLRFSMTPERRLVRPGGCARHVDFHLIAPPSSGRPTRQPVFVAILLDRSGPMQGRKPDHDSTTLNGHTQPAFSKVR